MAKQPNFEFAEEIVFIPSEHTLDVLRSGAIKAFRAEQTWNVKLGESRGMLLRLTSPLDKTGTPLQNGRTIIEFAKVAGLSTEYQTQAVKRASIKLKGPGKVQVATFEWD